MKNYKMFRTILLVSLVVTALSSCSDDDTKIPVKEKEEVSFKENLTNIANNVIVETYSDLANKAADLLTEASDFKNNKSASNLDNAKQAWRSTRQPWESSEGFLIGPVDTQGIDPAIDSWPVNTNDMDALLASGQTITEAIVDQQTDEAKGFHLIEYLLWGIDGNKQVGDFTDEELEYLVAACENLKNKTAALKDAWVSTGGNYVANFLTAGPNSTGIYKSEKSALEDLVTGMITIADEVANGKIEVPLNGENGGGVDPTQEESRFSHNSKIDFANNVRSLSNVYNGKFLTDGKGLSEVVATKDEALDTQIKDEMVAAIHAIEAIPGTFTDAIINNRAAVENAQNKVRTVQETLESKIKPLISNL